MRKEVVREGKTETEPQYAGPQFADMQYSAKTMQRHEG